MEKFNAYNYFKLIHEEMPELQGFEYGRAADRDNLVDIVQQARLGDAFFSLDDTDNGRVINLHGGYFDRRVYVLFLLKKFTMRAGDTMGNSARVLDECRTIFHKTISKLIHDKSLSLNGLDYMNENFDYYELPLELFPEAAGLYFMITVDHPLNLCYHDLWPQP